MIVIVYPQCHGVGGIARYLDGLLSHLPQGGPRVVLITGSDRHGPPVPALAWPGVEVIELPLPAGRAGLLRWSRLARRALRQLQGRGLVTAVNLHLPPLIPALFFLGLGASTPLVVTAHTTYAGLSGRFEAHRHFASAWGPVSLAVHMRIERLAFARAATVICLTEQARQELALYGRHDRIAVIPNGVDTEAFCPDPTVAPEVDVLFAGRLEPRKGSRAMAAVCRHLAAADPALRMAIAGYGDDEDWLRRELAPVSQQVRLLGRVPMDRMAAQMRRARVYASTSFYEGLPGTCLEAMACALPVVVWDRLFYRGLVVDGDTGCVVDTGDAAAMAGRLLGLLRSPAQAAAMGRRARDAVQRQYGWQHLARQVIEACQPPQPLAPHAAARSGGPRGSAAQGAAH